MSNYESSIASTRYYSTQKENEKKRSELGMNKPRVRHQDNALANFKLKVMVFDVQYKIPV